MRSGSRHGQHQSSNSSVSFQSTSGNRHSAPATMLSSGGGIALSARAALPTSPNIDIPKTTAIPKTTKRKSGSGRAKRNKVLPTRVTKDPEMDELDRRLGSTKKWPRLVNGAGKWLLGKNGPAFQDRIERFGMTLIKVRERFHPLHVRHLVLMVAALTAHMLLQLWLYHTDRFNLYLVLVCVAQFSNRLYRQWGKAFVLGLKEAAKSRRLRLALANAPSLSSPDAASLPPQPRSPPPSTPHPPTPWVQGSRRSSSKQKHTAFAFAPPGATLVDVDVQLMPTAGVTSRFGGLSPVRQARSSISSAAEPRSGDDGAHTPGGISPYRGLRESSPRPPLGRGNGNSEGGSVNVKLRRWSYPWGKSKRRSHMGKLGRWSESGVRGRSKGVTEASPGWGDVGSEVDAAATPPTNECQTVEGASHVMGTQNWGGVVAAPPTRPLKPRKSVRRVRWGRVLATFLALGCVIGCAVAACRVISGGDVLSWFSGTFGYAEGQGLVGSWWRDILEMTQWASLLELPNDFTFNRLSNMWAGYVWGNAEPTAMDAKEF